MKSRTEGHIFGAAMKPIAGSRGAHTRSRSGLERRALERDVRRVKALHKIW